LIIQKTINSRFLDRRVIMKRLSFRGLYLVLLIGFVNEAFSTRKFEALGPTEPVKPEPMETGVVEVFFDLLPTSMRFNMPSYPCMVTENNIQYSNCYTETYEPRIRGGSFEVNMDRRNTYARMWIESQNDARIVVRARGALSDRDDNIAHTDIPSNSPYGLGDWVDEWYYIYPDAVHVRHVKIYTGLAPRSRPFGFDREPPSVVHEFMESTVFGAVGHVPTDDIEIEALTLIRIAGKHTEIQLPKGESTTISYKPYPKDFGDFSDANILVINLKSKYKPFTIALPYGIRIQPYWPEDDLPFVFQTWGRPPERGYATAFGHILNFWHYKRSNNVIENVYLSGMTDAKNPADELAPLAWSWIQAPKLRMEGLKPSYDKEIYDQAQKAYILRTAKINEPSPLNFTLEADDEPLFIRNPVFIVKDWGNADVSIKIDGKTLKQGKDYRIGYEKPYPASDLIVWVKKSTDKSMNISISPVSR